MNCKWGEALVEEGAVGRLARAVQRMYELPEEQRGALFEMVKSRYGLGGEAVIGDEMRGVFEEVEAFADEMFLSDAEPTPMFHYSVWGWLWPTIGHWRRGQLRFDIAAGSCIIDMLCHAQPGRRGLKGQIVDMFTRWPGPMLDELLDLVVVVGEDEGVNTLITFTACHLVMLATHMRDRSLLRSVLEN